MVSREVLGCTGSTGEVLGVLGVLAVYLILLWCASLAVPAKGSVRFEGVTIRPVLSFGYLVFGHPFHLLGQLISSCPESSVFSCFVITSTFQLNSYMGCFTLQLNPSIAKAVHGSFQFTLSAFLDEPRSPVSSLPPPRYRTCVPSFFCRTKCSALLALLVRSHRILPTHALALSAIE